MGIVLVLAYLSSYPMVLASPSSYLLALCWWLPVQHMSASVFVWSVVIPDGVVLVLAYPIIVLDGVGLSVVVPIGIVPLLACSSGPSPCSRWPLAIRHCTYWRLSFILVSVGACCLSVCGHTRHY
jgi:hypothetical protein